MEHCYLCGANSEIEKRGNDSYVNCSGECGPGPYRISRIELNNVTGISGTKIHGRKHHVIEAMKILRKKDPNRLIWIHNNKVEFDPSK